MSSLIENKSLYEQKERHSNTYFDMEDFEIRRLKVQQNLMRDFDRDVVSRISDSFEELRILDIGSNTGEMIMDRFGHDAKLKNLIGLEYSQDAVDFANGKYKSEKIFFKQTDVEADDFSEVLESLCAECGVDKFNVVTISMLLMHIKQPLRLLQIVRKFLEKDGVIFIRDIDDGFNVAYPDEKGYFDRAIKMCSNSEISGYRHSGREIFYNLYKAGFKNIKLERNGMDTVSMDYAQREALFDTYFSFILDDTRIMSEKYPNIVQYKEDYNWMKDVYKDMHDDFMSSDMFFNLGFMVYTAMR